MLSKVISLLASLALFIQGLLAFIFFTAISNEYLAQLSSGKSSSIKTNFNLTTLFAGIGLAGIIYYSTSMIGNIDMISNLLFVIICVIACIVCWFLIPGYVINREVIIKNIDLASSLILFILGIIIGYFMFKALNQVSDNAIPILIMLVLQSLFVILMYYIGDGGTKFIVMFYIFFFVGLVAAIINIVLVMIRWKCQPPRKYGLIQTFQKKKVRFVDQAKALLRKLRRGEQLTPIEASVIEALNDPDILDSTMSNNVTLPEYNNTSDSDTSDRTASTVVIK